MASLQDRLGALIGAIAWRAYRNPRTILVLVLALTVVAVVGARRLTLDTDLVHLLPSSFQSVQAVEKLEQRFWGLGYVAVVASGAEPEVLRQFADELAPQLEKLETIRFVDYRRPVKFFRDHALYYIDVEDLETVRDRLEERRIYEIQLRSELMRGVLDEDELVKPELDFTDLRDKYAKRLKHRFGTSWTVKTPAKGGDYYLDPDQRLIVLLAKPARRASDVGFVKRTVTEVETLIAGLDLERYGPDLQLQLSGRYPKKIEQGKQLIADLGLASTVALVLMLLYLGLHYRRVGAVALVFLPLLAGVTWTFGFAGLVFGELNLLTGFIGAILLGLGIDHGVHLLGRYDDERAQGRSTDEALRRCFESTGPAVVVAGLTTIVAFAGVGLSEFRAFHEFGVLAAVGMVFVIGAYGLVLPALLGLQRRAQTAASPARDEAASAVPRVTSSLGRALPSWAPTLFWGSAVLAALIIAQVPQNRFDHDFASLEDSDLPAFRLDKVVNRLLGHSQTPMVVLTDSVAGEREALQALRNRPQAQPGRSSTVQLVAGVGDLVPDDPQAKQAVIAELHEEVRRIRPAWLEPHQQDQLEEIKRMTSAKPFDRADLPIEMRRQFQGPGAAADSGFVMIYPAVSLSDGKAIGALAEELRTVRLVSGEPLTVAGGAMVLADMLDLIEREGGRIIGLTVGLVFIVLMLLIRRKGDGLWSLATATSTLALTAGLMPLTGVRLNYLNIVLVPVLFGIAIDGAVHLTTRVRECGDVGLALSETGRSIAGSLLTTGLGLGAFLLANHPGLRSIGELAVLGLAVNLLVCLVLLPAVLTLYGSTPTAVQAADGECGTRRASSPPMAGGWISTLATVGKAGYAPIGPGTLGALVALPVGWVLAGQTVPLRAAVVGALVVLSVPVVGRFLRRHRESDPSEVVLDELVGCLVAMAFVPAHPLWLLSAFGLFRLFDIAKPWPVSWLDRKAPGAWGVIGDDVAAGLLAGVVLLGAQQVLPWGT